jgi:hypothetical protein
MEPTPEPPRLLHRQLGYTSSTVEALAREPEAVPADYQQHLTSRAQRTVDRRRRDGYQHQRTVIERAIEALESDGIVTRTDTRLLRRELERLERRVALLPAS